MLSGLLVVWCGTATGPTSPTFVLVVSVNPAGTGIAKSTRMVFSATGAPSDSQYQWDFGDGSPTTTGASVSHIFPRSGEFTVTATATDSGGRTLNGTRSVTITPNQSPVVSRQSPVVRFVRTASPPRGLSGTSR
jgi:PKD repeat protein